MTQLTFKLTRERTSKRRRRNTGTFMVQVTDGLIKQEHEAKVKAKCFIANDASTDLAQSMR